MSLNVLKDFPYSKRYYLTHPWKWFREIWLNLRAAHHRAIKGYCYSDLWNIDDWFLTIFPKLLRELADKHSAYPGSEPFETPEKWEEWLRKMASQLEYCSKDPDDFNEYYYDFHYSYEERHIPSPSTDEKIIISHRFSEEKRKEIADKYWMRNDEIVAAQQKVLEETMAEIMKHFHCLWD